MSFSGDVEEFLETLGPFYEFVNLEGSEMDHIKKSLDEWTSSSSSSMSSSLNTSAQTTPIKHIHSDESEETYLDKKEERLAVMNGHGFESTITKSKSNGHLPNHSYENEPSISSRYPPPSARVHHRSGIPNGFMTNGTGSSEAEETPEDILKVDLEEDAEDPNQHSVLNSRVSVETINSGTDSDKYYSGDSEPELEASVSTSTATFVGDPFPSPDALDSSDIPVMMNSNGLVRVGKTRSNQNQNQRISPFSDRLQLQKLPAGYQAAQSPDMVLHTTVDRLNRDVDHILARLRILEAAYATNGQFPSQQVVRRRPFGEVSRGTLTLIFAWPFVAYFIIKLIKLWLNRRRAQ